MTELVQTEQTKITEIEDISKGTKVLSAMGTGFFSAVAGLSVFTGYYAEAIALTALTAGNIALTGHWVTHDLTQNLRFQGVSGSFKSSVFALWGKKKVYSVTTPGKGDTEIPAELIIGRGKTQLVEHIPVEPLDLWDASMVAAINIYGLKRGSSQRLGSFKDDDFNPYASPMGSEYFNFEYAQASFDAYVEAVQENGSNLKYEFYLREYENHLYNLKLQDAKIEKYNKEIAYLEGKTGCQIERLKAKKRLYAA